MRRISLCLSTLASASLALVACGGDDTGAGGSGATTSSSSSMGGAGGAQGKPPASEDWTRDILSTDLTLDVATLTGRATLTLAGSDSTAGSFEIGDLEIASVSDASGELNFAASAGQLDVGIPSGGGDATLVVDYTFKPHTEFDGWMPEQGVTFVWPRFCGNLFPCKSDPAEGLTFTLGVTGADPAMTAVFPAAIPADAPSYMPAVAIAPFAQLDLGVTSGGTQVGVWYRANEEADALSGTAHLLEVFDLLETTYGAYTFGPSVGSVSANWGGGDYGGMEHHPLWHVSSGSMYSEEVHAHEAAHGWFGNGVRIACWEDFVLSEGTVSYMAAHLLGQLGVDLWPDYECLLKYHCDPASMDNTIALPDATCNEIDLVNDPLWSNATYMKGAYFFRDVGQAIGAGVLDEALAEFYAAHVGKPARMQQLIDHIKTKTDAAGGAAVDALATDWLRTLDCPVDHTTLCPAP
jgi:aminopeptidase N